MTITNERRHHLYQRLEDVLGSEEASTLMDHLPPVGWGDVATRTQLSTETAALRSELDATESRLRSEIHKGQRDLVFAMIASNATLAALAFAAATLV